MIKKAFFWENGNIPSWLDFDYYEDVVDDLRAVLDNLRRRHVQPLCTHCCHLSCPFIIDFLTKQFYER